MQHHVPTTYLTEITTPAPTTTAPLLSDLCRLHSLRRINTINQIRHRAYGELTLSSLNQFDKMAVLISNAKQGDLPCPALRKSAINDLVEMSTPMVCTCSAVERKIPYFSLNIVKAKKREENVENTFLKQLASFIRFESHKNQVLYIFA